MIWPYTIPVCLHLQARRYGNRICRRLPYEPSITETVCSPSNRHHAIMLDALGNCHHHIDIFYSNINRSGIQRLFNERPVSLVDKGKVCLDPAGDS
jgi:hypothetical protein